METPLQTLTDVMDPARAQAMQAALGRPDAIGDGSPLPPFYHQLYFWDPQPPDALGRDGHPRVGAVIPDMGLPRRMWAGGRLAFDAPLVAGRVAERRTFLESSVRKQGRSGALGFVTLRHEIRQAGRLCVTDWQDLVYRAEPAPGTAPPAPPVAPDDEAGADTLTFDSTLLFRYSALTLNGHRIHYDMDYATGVEGYRGLVVHGPLLAQILMLRARETAGSLRRFRFRATAPLLQGETATFCWRGDRFWVRGPDGRQCMSAHANS